MKRLTEMRMNSTISMFALPCSYSDGLNNRRIYTFYFLLDSLLFDSAIVFTTKKYRYASYL